MKRLCMLVITLLMFAQPALALVERGANTYASLCYHDVVDIKLTPNLRIFPQTITRDRLVEHFNLIKQNGFQPVSFQHILDAKAGKRMLPNKAVLLTFDDAYESFYSLVYPLLRLYNYPAVLAVVGEWLDVPDKEKVPYGKVMLPRDRFVRWPQIREMQASGLVEIASHTYGSHYGIIANPYGNEQPAMTSPGFDPKTKQYETLEQYNQRINQDLSASKAQLVKYTQTSPRIIVWPYGKYNGETLNVASNNGMPYSFSLDEGVNHLTDSGSKVKRYLIEQETSLETLKEILTGTAYESKVKRVVHVDLDYVFDPNPSVQNRNIDKLIKRIFSYGIDTVYLQAFADPDGDGVANQLYFPNRHLPVRADLFNRVAWQLTTRCEVDVYACMPVLAFDLGKSYEYVHDARFNGPDKQRYLRLSPFDSNNRKVIGEIYQDLGAYGNFGGLLLHDDAFLTDFEDSSKAAIPRYRTWGFSGSVKEMRKNPSTLAQWTAKKIDFLNSFTVELADQVKKYRSVGKAKLKLARNIYAKVILEPESMHWFSQSLSSFANIYEYTVIMAMPYMEGAEEPLAWLSQLAKQTLQQVNRDKVLFELQAIDWRTGKPISAQELAEQMEVVRQNNILNFGYYPDDFVKDKPDMNTLRPVFSNRSELRREE